MQYYLKIFNKKTGDLVGYYKETGRNCVSKLPKGIKYWNDLESAVNTMIELDDGFLRDKDKHYYGSFVCVYGDSSLKPTKEEKKTIEQEKEELADELEAFIRKTRSKNERQTGN